APGYDDVPVARACCASTALPLFYSPVRIRDRHYIDGGVGRVGHLDVAEREGADLGVHARLHYALEGAYKVNGQPAGVNVHIPLLLIEPEPTDAVLFMHNPASFAARRTILEYAYKTTRERVARWIDANKSVIERAGLRPRSGRTVRPPE